MDWLRWILGRCYWLFSINSHTTAFFHCSTNYLIHVVPQIKQLVEEIKHKVMMGLNYTSSLHKSVYRSRFTQLVYFKGKPTWHSHDAGKNRGGTLQLWFLNCWLFNGQTDLQVNKGKTARPLTWIVNSHAVLSVKRMFTGKFLQTFNNCLKKRSALKWFSETLWPSLVAFPECYTWALFGKSCQNFTLHLKSNRVAITDLFFWGVDLGTFLNHNINQWPDF